MWGPSPDFATCPSVGIQQAEAFHHIDGGVKEGEGGNTTSNGELTLRPALSQAILKAWQVQRSTVLGAWQKVVQKVNIKRSQYSKVVSVDRVFLASFAF